MCFTGFSIVIFFGAIFQRLKAFAQLFSASLVMLEAKAEAQTEAEADAEAQSGAEA